MEFKTVMDREYFGTREDYLINSIKQSLEESFLRLEGGAEVVFVENRDPLSALLENSLENKTEILVSASISNYTKNILAGVALNKEINIKYIDINNSFDIVGFITKKTRMIYFESLDNDLQIPEWSEIEKVAKEHDLKLVVDNTNLTSLVFNPFEWGADFVIYSNTSFIGGFHNTNGGIIVSSQDANTKGIVRKIRENLENSTEVVDKINSILLFQGIEYLPLKVEKQNDNALALAEALLENPKIDLVNYPGLSCHKNFKKACTYLKDGFGNKLTFAFKDENDAHKFINSFTMANREELDMNSILRSSTRIYGVRRRDNKILITLTVGLEEIDNLSIEARVFK